MGLSRLSEKCRVCPKVDTCQNKRMEALAFLDGPCEMELAAGTATPGAMVVTTEDDMEALIDALKKGIAIAAQIPQHILCKHYLP